MEVKPTQLFEVIIKISHFIISYSFFIINLNIYKILCKVKKKCQCLNTCWNNQIILLCYRTELLLTIQFSLPVRESQNIFEYLTTLVLIFFKKFYICSLIIFIFINSSIIFSRICFFFFFSFTSSWCFFLTFLLISSFIA